MYGGAATAYFFAHLVMIFGVLALAAVPVGTAVSPAVELVTVAAVVGCAFALEQAPGVRAVARSGKMPA